MDRYRGDRYGDYSTTSYGPNYDNRHHFYDGDDRPYHHHDRHYYNRHHDVDHLHPNFNGEENYLTSSHHDSNLPLSGHKRPISQSGILEFFSVLLSWLSFCVSNFLPIQSRIFFSDFVDFVKLFVGGVPRTITEQDVSSTDHHWSVGM